MSSFATTLELNDQLKLGYRSALTRGTPPPHVLRQVQNRLADAVDKVSEKMSEREWKGLAPKYRAAAAELNEGIIQAEVSRRLAASGAQPVAGQDTFNMQTTMDQTASKFRNIETGALIRSYQVNEPIAKATTQPDYGIGEVVRAVTTGDWSRLPSSLQRAGAAGLGPAGGFLVPGELSGYIIDLARAEARVLQAGAITLPVDHGTLTIATVGSDPTPDWKSENSWFATSQGTYGQIVLTARTLGVIVPLSLELITSASNIDRLVTTQLSKRMALTLDAAAIYGTGFVSSPQGIINQGIGDVPVGATPTNYAAFNSAIGSCLAANADLNNLSVLMNSDANTLLDGLTDSLGQPLRPSPNYASIRNRRGEYITNSIGTSGTPASTFAVVGDFSNVIIGMQQNLMLEVSREGGYKNGDGSIGNAFGQGQVLIRAYMMADVAVQRASFFAQVSDIRIP